MGKNNKPRALLPYDEALGVQRALRNWLNGSEALPTGAAVRFEDLEANAAGFAMASIQSPAYAARYILGGYRAEYRFRIIYRALPSDDGDMLDAVETLGRLAAWAEHAAPPVIEGTDSGHITRNTDVAVLAAYDDGTIDYAVDLTFTWEVF